MKKLVAFATIAMFASTTAWSQVLSIGTNPSGTSAYSVGAAIAKAVSENTKLKMRIAPQGGPVVTIPLLNKGEFEFSMGVSVVAFLAHKGGAMFKKIGPQKNMRILATVLPSPIAYMTRRSAGLNSLDDLRVEDTMTTPVYVFENDPLDMVLNLMVQRQVLRMPVVGDGNLVGVISWEHVLRHCLPLSSSSSRFVPSNAWCERVPEPSDGSARTKRSLSMCNQVSGRSGSTRGSF